MKRVIFFLTIIFFAMLIVLQNACVKDMGPLPTKAVVSQPLCDSLNVKFSTDIITIMQANCVMCHPGTGAPGNFNLYSDVQIVALNGKLWNRVNTVGDMPPAGKLPDSELQKINCWLTAGAPNN